MLIVVTTAPVLLIPVKPPVVAVEVVPRMTLLLMFKTPGSEELTIPTIELEEAAPLTTQLRTVLLFMLIVAVLRADVMPWLRIASKVPDVNPLDMVTVLFPIVEVNVPVGAVTV